MNYRVSILTALIFSLLFTSSLHTVYASTLFSDTFDRPDSSTISNGWIEDLGDWSIVSNELTSIIQDNLIVHNLYKPTTPDYYVKVDAKSADAYNDSPAILSRFTDINNFYLFQTAANRAQLLKRVNGVWTMLDDEPYTRSANTFNTYELSVNNNTINAYIDNNLTLSAIDNDLTVPGYAGLRRGGGLFQITFDNFEIGDFSTPTPTPTPSPTASPSPVPAPTITPLPTPTPLPVSKVFFIPGLGASWNADALLNCRADDNPNNWSLASYAADIYNPILTALSETGWNTIPFYYDWRKQIPADNANFSNFASSQIGVDEKFDLVGHSMGGLIGREYLESSDGNKLNSLLTVGTPHKGSAFAYPAWAGEDVWNDNFIQKIAITLYLKHCGGLRENIPSIQNLLPIEPFLQKVKSDSLYLPTVNINNWLTTHPFANPWNINVGTIAGSSFDTLNIIQTKVPTNKDIKDGYWLDGKPAGKIYSLEGDGTVLADSAILPEANYKNTINQTHAGLIDSVEGMSGILSFLGTPPTNNLLTTNIEPKSALVVVAYPANSVMVDQKGTETRDSKGMISFVNPKSGTYKLNILPRSNNTLLIVAQFLPNGDVKYKEYKLQGLGPKFKTLNFSIENPQEDILD